jgi:AcrR family transcriptional regulator
MATPKTTNDRAWDYGQLTVDDIVDRALVLIEREGVAKLTMRRLAQELGMSSMVTYYYVASKGEMLDLVIERIWDGIPMPGPEAGDWQERLRILAQRFREALIKYPGLVQIIQTRPMAPSARAHAHWADHLLLEAGMDKTLLYAVGQALFHYVFGAIAWEVQARAGGAGDVDEDELAARYAIGVDVMLAGLAVVVAGTSDRFGPDRRRPRRGAARKAARSAPLRVASSQDAPEG